MSSTELQRLETQREKIVARHEKELQTLDDNIKNIKRQQMEEIITNSRALGFHVTVTSNKAKKSSSTRKPATCKVCRAVELTGEGHTARSHDKWLVTQNAETKVKFK